MPKVARSTSQASLSSDNYFDDVYDDDQADNGSYENGDELERYLSTEPDRNARNPLVWWHENAHVYPRLLRMARDFLTIPGKSHFYLF